MTAAVVELTDIYRPPLDRCRVVRARRPPLPRARRPDADGFWEIDWWDEGPALWIPIRRARTPEAAVAEMMRLAQEPAP